MSRCFAKSPCCRRMGILARRTFVGQECPTYVLTSYQALTQAPAAARRFPRRRFGREFRRFELCETSILAHSAFKGLPTPIMPMLDSPVLHPAVNGGQSGWGWLKLEPLEDRTEPADSLSSPLRRFDASNVAYFTTTFLTRALGTHYHDGSVERFCQIIKC